MRTNMLAACAVLVAGFTASAQTPQTPPQPSTPSSPDTRPIDAASSVTITGCLATWDAKSMSGRADSASPSSSPSTSSSASGTYVLTNVQGAGSSASSTSAASSYVLKADSSVNLSAHLNHKVQIVGSVDKSAAHSGMSPSGQPSTARPGTPNPADPPSDMPPAASGTPRAHDMDSMKPATLKVTSVTMVSATCP